MNVPPENFDALRKLLAVKRLEQPPPGYFDRLAGKILWRLERGEGASSFWERLAQRLMVRPALAYGLVLTLCGGLAATAIYSFKLGATHTASQLAALDAWNAASTAGVEPISQGRSLHVLSWPGTTNPVAEPGPAHSLFQPINWVTRPAAYQPAN